MRAGTHDTAIVIVGGGIAGITVALELLEAGDKRHITIVDRRSEADFGGQALQAFGGMMLVDTPYQRRTGIKDSPEVALKDWLSFAEFGPEDHWPRAWAEYYVQNVTARVHDWVRGFGIKYLPMVQWVERGLYVPGNSVPRYHILSGTSKRLTMRLIAALKPAIDDGRVTCLFRHGVEGFLTKAGVPVGVHGVTEADQTPFEICADAIVVATGGIGGSIDLVKKHWRKDWGKPPDKILSGCLQENDGRLHFATQKIGGQLTHLDWMWNYAAGVHHPRPQFEGHGLSLVPTRSSLWLNHRGERIGPMPLVTGFDTNDLCRRVSALEKPWTWHVMNLGVARRELAISGADHNPLIRDRHLVSFLIKLVSGDDWLLNKMLSECRDFITAQSLPELAAKMNDLAEGEYVSAETLAHTLGQYDACLSRPKNQWNDDQIRRITHLRAWLGDRLRTCRYQKIMDPKALPYIGIRSHLISRKTLGGIQTDLDCRVLDAEGRPLGNVFAVGEAAGFGGGCQRETVAGRHIFIRLHTDRPARRRCLEGRGMKRQPKWNGKRRALNRYNDG